MTSAGLAGVDRDDVGAASGLIKTFHQLGSALGIFVAAGAAATLVSTALVNHVTTALTGGSIMLGAALALTLPGGRCRSLLHPSPSPARPLVPATEAQATGSVAWA